MSGKVTDNIGTGSGVISAPVTSTESSSDPVTSTNPATGVGTEWHNTTSGEIFICTDATAGANVWTTQLVRNVYGSRACFGGGGTSNVIDYIAIDAPADAADFGDLLTGRGNFDATDNGQTGRGVFMGGGGSTYTDTIEYITISSPGNSTDFGNLLSGRYGVAATSNGSNDRGISFGGVGQPWDGGQNVIQYITISSPGNAIDFGNLTNQPYMAGACSNGTNDRAVCWGGAGVQPAPSGSGANGITRFMQYVTISTPGNASDFGSELTTGTYGHGDDGANAAGCTSNGTLDRGVHCGGDHAGSFNIIQYITISSIGNATDFGDLTVASSWTAATSSGEGDRAVVGCIDNPTNQGIDYFTISSTGNAADFGEMTVARSAPAACSNGMN
tara:strand:- start:662 stop:1822 length:1161 start_codon:yes stop_codon:yes gene_type:complete